MDGNFSLEPVSADIIPQPMTTPRYAAILTTFLEGGQAAVLVHYKDRKHTTVVTGLRNAITKNGLTDVSVVTRKEQVYLVRNNRNESRPLWASEGTEQVNSE